MLTTGINLANHNQTLLQNRIAGIHHLESAITPNDRMLVSSRLDWLCQNLLSSHRQGYPPNDCLIDFVNDSHGNPVAKIFRIEQLLKQDASLALFFLGHPAVAGLGKQLCGPDVVPVYLSVQFRNRGETQEIIWHQDMIYDRQGPIYTVGLYLDDAWHNNGALRVIPDSHHEHADIAKLARTASSNTKDKPMVSSHSLSVKAGDIIAHDVMLVHCSDALTKTDCRRTLYVEFRHPQQARANPTMTPSWISQQQALLAQAQNYCTQVRAAGNFNDVALPETIDTQSIDANTVRLEPANYGQYQPALFEHAGPFASP